MTRVLIVHQFMAPGSPQDEQRGPMYTQLFRKAGMEPTFIGRQPLPGRILFGSSSRVPRQVRVSLEYRALDRLIAAAVRSAKDRRVVRAARDADVVMLIKTDSARLVREIRRVSRARLVYDLADIRQRHSPELMREIEQILPVVDAVTCDNALTMQWARERNPRVHHWPQASYVEAFDARRHLSRRGVDGRVRLGWVGSPSTASSLYLILESLEDVFRRHSDIDLRLVGLPDDHEILSRFEHVHATSREKYTGSDMVDEVLQMDIGLFPTYELQDAAMKGVTKALIYMGGGAAVICSRVGVIRDLVREGENGLFATGRAEWTTTLDRLIGDPQLRTRLTETARHSAAHHSLDRCFSHLLAALQQ